MDENNNEKKRLVFVDIETAGFHYQSPIIELAAVAVESGSYRELDSLDIKVQFEVHAPYVDLKALGINKFSPSIWQQYALPPAVAARNFVAFLRQHATQEQPSSGGKPFVVTKLAAHNADFDNGRLQRWCQQHLPKTKSGKSAFYPASYLALCTVQKAAWFFSDNQGITPPQNLKLKTLAKYFGLTEQPDHTALADTRTAVELARVLAEFHRVTTTAQAA